MSLLIQDSYLQYIFTVYAFSILVGKMLKHKFYWYERRYCKYELNDCTENSTTFEFYETFLLNFLILCSNTRKHLLTWKQFTEWNQLLKRWNPYKSVDEERGKYRHRETKESWGRKVSVSGWTWEQYYIEFKIVCEQEKKYVRLTVGRTRSTIW